MNGTYKKDKKLNMVKYLEDTKIFKFKRNEVIKLGYERSFLISWVISWNDLVKFIKAKSLVAFSFVFNECWMHEL